VRGTDGAPDEIARRMPRTRAKGRLLARRAGAWPTGARRRTARRMGSAWSEVGRGMGVSGEAIDGKCGRMTTRPKEAVLAARRGTNGGEGPYPPGAFPQESEF